MEKILSIHNDLINSLHLQTYIKFNNYIISPYVIKLKCNEGILWYNNLTCELLLLNENEEKELNINKYLIQHWYYIPDFINPKTLAYTVRQIILNRNPNTKTLGMNFVIPTTTVCNARCLYCYECDFEQKHMTKEKALDIAKFLEERSKIVGKLHICWFGGEPLCNKEVINLICDYLNEHDVKFYSSMISNGYLINTISLKDFKYRWHFDRVQITLDGTKEIYEKIKNYKDEKENSFERVLNNVESFLENGIQVSIRMNVGLYNGDDLFELTKQLVEKFKNYKRFSMYATPLFLGQGNPPLELTNEESHQVVDYCIKIEDYLRKYNLGVDYGVFADNFKLNHCMADQYKAPVITMDGNLTPCEHYFDEHICGNIYEGITDYDELEAWTEFDNNKEACETCFWYPKCVHLKHCPNELLCEEPQRKLNLYKLENAIKKSYKRYCANKNR